jgi:hypothetical protein
MNHSMPDIGRSPTTTLEELRDLIREAAQLIRAGSTLKDERRSKPARPRCSTGSTRRRTGCSP